MRSLAVAIPLEDGMGAKNPVLFTTDVDEIHVNCEKFVCEKFVVFAFQSLNVFLIVLIRQGWDEEADIKVIQQLHSLI